MKKKVLLFFGLLFVSIGLFAQEITPPESWTDIVINLKGLFGSFVGIAAVTTFAATFFIGLLKVEKGFVKQLVAWGVGIILVVVASLVKFGYAADLPLGIAVLHGFAAGLASNGIADVPFLKDFLDVIEGLFEKKEEKEE